MAATPANPCPRTVLDADLGALESELWSTDGAIDGERLEAASLLVRAARELVRRAREPLDRDAHSMARVTAGCLSASGVGEVEPADVASALTMIAKKATVRSGDIPPSPDEHLAHVRATLAEIAASETCDAPPCDSSL
jgi:hypothetical protein